MEATSLLLLFLAIQGGSCSDKYCTEQRGNVIVEEKESVTISCNYTYPKQKDKSVEVRVSWRQGGLQRCGQGLFIYNHSGGWTHENYTGRISQVKNFNTEGRATIKINNLKKTDGPMFCCRVEIYDKSQLKEGWQNPPGTFIRFKDEPSVEQVDVVPANIEEDIVIPCLVHNKGSSLINDVTWTVGSSDLCVENNEKTLIWNYSSKSPMERRWSIENFPQDLSLRIKKVTSEDNKHYCCRVKTKLRSKLISPIQSTEVILVAGSNDPKLKVVQPEETSPNEDGSATLNCSFTYQSDTAPLWTEVFWRVGSPNGDYAYHSFTNMVPSSYRGRTELRGTADLHITGIKDTDDTTYYCFVMLKFCIGNNKTSSTIQHGRGTKLEVKVTDIRDPNSDPLVYILSAVLLAVIIVCAVVIIILKKKGVICKKHSRREDVNYLTSDVALKEQNPSSNVQTPRATSSSPPMAQEDSGGILYAHLNVSSLHPKTSNGGKGSKSDNDSQVLYAAVKSPGAHQDIYSTVNK